MKKTMTTLAAVAGLLAMQPASGQTAEPAQDENLAYATGVQTYINGFPMMDLYRTLWETSFDPERGHDRTLNEFFVFDRLVTSADDWVVTANEDVIYLRAFLDLSLSDRTKNTVYGKDGSFEIFLQHEEPTDPKERANWLPASKGRFYLVTRHYSPRGPILTGDWTPPPVTAR